MNNCVLGYLVEEGKVLLAMKKKGFGKNRYNGFGGKVEKGEDFEQALVREAQEEIGVTPEEYRYMGELTFYNGEEKEVFVKVYKITKWQGEPKESEEMKPEWFSVDKIPYHQMWPDDIHWFPLVLNGKKVEASFWFKDLSGEEPKLLKHEVETF